MKFFDERIQNHLLNGGKIKRVSENSRITYRPIKFIDDMLCFADKPNEYYRLSKNNLATDDWEIVEPEYDWDKIIKDKILCVFSNEENYRNIRLSRLSLISDGKFKLLGGLSFNYCKPFNPAEYNIVKNIKEYEK